MQKVNELYPNVQKALYGLHARNIRKAPQPNNRASNIGSECKRQLVYNRIAWEEREDTPIERQLIFDEGNLHERQIMIELLQLGFEVTEQQASGFDEGSGLSWHLDAILEWEGKKYPFEIKSCAQYIYDALVKYDEREFKKAMDELGSFYPWLKKYPAQVLTYCNGKGLDYGIILFKNKQNGRLKQFVIDANDHREYYKEITEKSKAVNVVVNQFKEKGLKFDSKGAEDLLPEQINNTDECKFCDFRMICLPDTNFGQPLSLLSDKEAESKIDKWYKYGLIAKEHAAINKELSVWTKGKENSILGRYHISGKYNKAGNWLKSITVVQNEDKKLLEKESNKLLTAIAGKDK